MARILACFASDVGSIADITCIINKYLRKCERAMYAPGIQARQSMEINNVDIQSVHLIRLMY